MKFEKVVKGKRAEDSIEVPGFFDEDGKPFVVLAVPITGIEYIQACADARARAVEKGVTHPGIGDPIYDLSLMAFILAAGCLDPDSPEEKRTKSFKDGHEILADIHPETIAYMHERHELHQSDCSPNVYRLEGGDNELYKMVSEVAAPDGRNTFMKWSQSMRVSFSLSMARTLKEHWDSLKLKSLGGSTSESNELIEKSNENETPEKKPSDSDSNKKDSKAE